MKQRKSYCAAQSTGTTGNESYFAAEFASHEGLQDGKA